MCGTDGRAQSCWSGTVTSCCRCTTPPSYTPCYIPTCPALCPESMLRLLRRVGTQLLTAKATCQVGDSVEMGAAGPEAGVQQALRLADYVEGLSDASVRLPKPGGARCWVAVPIAVCGNQPVRGCRPGGTHSTGPQCSGISRPSAPTSGGVAQGGDSTRAARLESRSTRTQERSKIFLAALTALSCAGCHRFSRSGPLGLGMRACRPIGGSAQSVAAPTTAGRCIHTDQEGGPAE